jgi:penicillin-binding protein 2
LQLLQHERFEDLSQRNYERSIRLPALRGRVFDRTGRLLADNAPVYDLAFTREGISRKQFADCLETAAPLISLSTQELWKRWKDTPRDRYGYRVLVRNLDPSVVVALEERKWSLPAVEVVAGPRRWTVYGEVGAHVLGYTGEVGPEEYERRKDEGVCPGDEVGKGGIERVFETYLRGQDGEKHVRVFSSGLVHSEVFDRNIDPVPGNDLYLTLDWELETAADEILGASAGTLIAVDPKNGDVLAMVSHPGYDPNLFSLRSPEIERLLREKVNGVGRMVNIALEAYPPGSIYKIPYVLAAIDHGDVDPRLEFDCAGRYELPGISTESWDCWIYGTNRVGHGPMNAVTALQHSCDCYFYELGRKLGVNRMDEYTRSFGFGELTGIDLPSEKKGFRPCREHKMEAIRRFGGRDGQWYPGDTINASIGQGIVMATPLQIAMMTAMAANKGTLWKPRLVREVQSAAALIVSNVPEPRLPRRNWSSRALETVDEGLYRVVNQQGGTAYTYRIPGLTFCGKTGTAQSTPGRSSHAWFTCYAPREDPQVVVTVFLPWGGHGASSAAPLARRFLMRYFGSGDPSGPEGSAAVLGSAPGGLRR